MGTHKKGPSIIKYPTPLAGTLLSDWIKGNQWALGDKVAKEFSGELPFLLKILSVKKALSIQAHPDKKRAKDLHSLAPDKYPDPNHKPELVVALREFEGLIGFRPFTAIQSWVMKVPELQKVGTWYGMLKVLKMCFCVDISSQYMLCIYSIASCGKFPCNCITELIHRFIIHATQV